MFPMKSSSHWSSTALGVGDGAPRDDMPRGLVWRSFLSLPEMNYNMV
jgi:hypothetical protein